MTKDQKNRQEPTGFGGAELVLVGPAVALTKNIYDAWKEGRPAVSASDPLVFGVVDSVTNSSGHKLTILCSNIGPHGVYVEQVDVVDPPRVTATTRQEHPAAPTMPFGEAKKPTYLPLPIFLPSGDKAILDVNLSTMNADRMSEMPFGKLRVFYTVVGVARAGLHKTVEFSVRPLAE